MKQAINKRRQIPLSMPDPDPAACSLDMRMAVCRKVPLFADLDDGQLAQVNRHCQAQNFAAGEPVYLEGDAATHIYVVAIGAVKTTRLAADGRQSLIDLLTPGDFFGALPALGQQFYADSATALTPACLLGLDAPEYDAILQEIPQVAVATLKGVAHRLTQSQHAIHMLAGAPLEQRLAALLLVLADKVGKPWNEAMLLDVPLAREDLAAMAGAATESVSRLFSQWQREGWIDAGRRWVAIVDAARLEQVRDGMV
ncbi:MULTISPECIES: Crp/Fnr family transcriptional regulator [Betaproteobacteria]|jgi:CRP-like cAMP-binding protein|uniref:Crp/Fnr family transcriptional regulator n=2 Tax=Burkholderiales TaxID=80840 RepID=A0A5B8RQB6_9BURK|nr:cyclic nucleotide-binding protein [Alicycliphilus denitrificans BC]QEA11726.1 Crp/Fnr family transcriptional regulator [Comamonas flocculans]